MKNEHRINTIYKFLCIFEAQLYLLSLDEYLNPRPYKEKLQDTIDKIKKEVESLKEENAYSPHLKFGLNKYLKVIKLLCSLSQDAYADKKRPVKINSLTRASHAHSEDLNKILSELEELGMVRMFKNKNLNKSTTSFVSLRG